MNLAFVYVTKGLQVSFRIISKVPSGVTTRWGFGDFKESSSNDRSPSYTYETAGFYTVTLRVTIGEETIEQSQLVMVSDDENITTHLSDSIYNLIDNYIPKELGNMSMDQKVTYITKWQLYLGPLVNHEISPDKYQDELAYEGLENQLVMELAAWEYLNVQITALLARTNDFFSKFQSQPESSTNPEEEDSSTRIKKITTGPTEVEYFDKYSDSIASWWKYYMQALQPGGIIDELRVNLCTLAQRLDIYLPFCDKVRTSVVPKVVNHRKAGHLGGPNPIAPLNKGNI
jgi:PKD repeat protein